MKKFLILLGVVMALVVTYFILIEFMPIQSRPDVGNYYQGSVTSVTTDLKFRLDCCDQELQLKMVKVIDESLENLAKIKTVMQSYSLACSAGIGGQKVETDRVYCSTDEGLISEILLNEGLVVENCAESGNQFGTCT